MLVTRLNPVSVLADPAVFGALQRLQAAGITLYADELALDNIGNHMHAAAASNPALVARAMATADLLGRDMEVVPVWRDDETCAPAGDCVVPGTRPAALPAEILAGFPEDVIGA